MQKRDFETYQKRFRDFEILPKFSEIHVFRGTIRHPLAYTVRLVLCPKGVSFSGFRYMKGGGGGILIFEVYERLLKQSLVLSGAHKRERLTSILRLCNDVFTSRSIFR